MGRTERADQRRVRLADVAHVAGVSVGTASKALSGSGRLRVETRSRVKEVAERLGFAPDAVARGLVVGRTFTVAVLTDDSFGRFSLPVMLGAEDALGAGDVAVMLCDTRDDPAREEHYVRALDARRVDGIIATGRRTEPRERLRTTTDVPVVYAFTPCKDPTTASVVADGAGGAALAIEHLLAQGRGRIAIVAGPAHHRAASERADAAASCLRAAGLAPVLWRHGPWSEAWGREAARELVGVSGGIDGVMCASDQLARGVLEGLRSAGRAVPEDVAVTGFDDWDVMALASQPPLTSIDLCLTAVGRRAAELLLRSIEGEHVAGVHTVRSRLVVRGSTVRAD